MTSTYDFMRTALAISETSNCRRRKIGAVVGSVHIPAISAANFAGDTCETCRREHKTQVECRAVHAEVAAVTKFLSSRRDGSVPHLFVWSEVPCQQCLSFINEYTEIEVINCLSPSSYSAFYPRVLEYGDALAERRRYAKELGLVIVEHDAQLFI